MVLLRCFVSPAEKRWAKEEDTHMHICQSVTPVTGTTGCGCHFSWFACFHLQTDEKMRRARRREVACTRRVRGESSRSHPCFLCWPKESLHRKNNLPYNLYASSLPGRIWGSREREREYTWLIHSSQRWVRQLLWSAGTDKWKRQTWVEHTHWLCSYELWAKVAQSLAH